MSDFTPIRRHARHSSSPEPADARLGVLVSLPNASASGLASFLRLETVTTARQRLVNLVAQFAVHQIRRANTHALLPQSRAWLRSTCTRAGVDFNSLVRSQPACIPSRAPRRSEGTASPQRPHDRTCSHQGSGNGQTGKQGREPTRRIVLRCHTWRMGLSMRNFGGGDSAWLAGGAQRHTGDYDGAPRDVHGQGGAALT